MEQIVLYKYIYIWFLVWIKFSFVVLYGGNISYYTSSVFEH